MGSGFKIPDEILRKIRRSQRNEITEYFVYRKLALTVESLTDRAILLKIADEEKSHYLIWKRYTKTELKPDLFRIYLYAIASRIFGITFVTKLMEKGEELAQLNYKEIAKYIPEAEDIRKDETVHEEELLGIINEERLSYVGSMVLGVNDAIVELTGVLSGLTLAFQNNKLIAVTGLITGIAAALSMAASEYLSVKSEPVGKNPVKAAFYTGLMYISAVTVLVSPFFFFNNVLASLLLTIFLAVLIIFLFTFYVSIAKGFPFFRRFFEMVGISLGVSALTFTLGFLARRFFGIAI